MTESDIAALVQMHAVYRMFGPGGRLLYVGMTGNLGSRLDSHAEKRWFPLVKSITLEWFPTREAAYEVEQAAIRREHPVYNTARRGRPLTRRPVALLTADEATLIEAVATGILGTSIHAARKASTRDPAFPRPTGRRGLEHLYDVSDLRKYQEHRRKKAS